MKEKRTLDQNKYFWKLLDEISMKVFGNKEKKNVDKIYLQLLDEAEIKSVKAIVKHNDLTDLDEIAKRYEVIKQETIMHVVYDTIKIYKSSSNFNTKEMSVLIDKTISKAEMVGVEYIAAYWKGITNDN